MNGGVATIPCECHRNFQNHFNTYYRSAERPYSDFAAGYEYGFRMANENRECKFEQVEQIFKADFLQAHPNCDWSKMRGAISYGWRLAVAGDHR